MELLPPRKTPTSCICAVEISERIRNKLKRKILFIRIRETIMFILNQYLIIHYFKLI
jgi:hypothetical protein